MPAYSSSLSFFRSLLQQVPILPAARAMAGEDVQLTYAIEWLDTQQALIATATPTQKAAPGIATVILALGLLAMIAGRK